MRLENSFSKLKIVLVEPIGPLNVGSIARLCANFEVDELRIVSPKCDISSLEARKMALKGQMYLENCKIFNRLEQAIFDCDLVLASSGRIEKSKDSFFESPEDISKWILSLKEIKNFAILFGREDRGLTNDELLLAHKTFCIPTSCNYPSLNLSHAVSITLYELSKTGKSDLNIESKVFNLASSKQITDSFLEIDKLLTKVGYLLKHTSRAKISKFKKFIIRANTTKHEINILRGIVHQINWYLENLKNKLE